MAPHKHLDAWPWHIVIGAFIKGQWDGVSHKELLAIAIALVGALSYWGFSNTLERLSRIETNQVAIRSEMTNEFTRLHEVDYLTKLTVTEIKERQCAVIEKLKELEKRH